MNRREALFAATGGLLVFSPGSKGQSNPVTFDGLSFDPATATGYHQALAELVQARDVGPTESQVSAAIDWTHLLAADMIASGIAARIDQMMAPSNPNGLQSGPVSFEAITAVQMGLMQIGIMVTVAQLPATSNFEAASAASQRLGGTAGLMAFFANHMLAKLYPATGSPLAIARRMRANDYYGCHGASQAMNLFAGVTYALAIPTYLGCIPCAALVLSMAPAAAVVSIYQLVAC